MKITGTQIIPAAREVVWNALNSPDVLKLCLPGCESVERTSEEEFRVVVVAAIGPLRARFNGKLRLTEVVLNESCVLVFEGQGGSIGFGKGSSSVTLRETPDGTELDYSAQAQVGGKLAQVGSRLIDSVAKKMADDFFKAFRKQLAPDEIADRAAAQVTAEASNSEANVADRTDLPIAAIAKSLARVDSSPLQPTGDNVSTIMVPGWWLAVAAFLGSAATISGVLLAR